MPAEPSDLDRFAETGDVEAEAIEDLQLGLALERIRRLPRDQADVVILRVLGGMSVQEVATIMRRRPGTIRVIQHRALRALARSMSREGVTR